MEKRIAMNSLCDKKINRAYIENDIVYLRTSDNELFTIKPDANQDIAHIELHSIAPDFIERIVKAKIRSIDMNYYCEEDYDYDEDDDYRDYGDYGPLDEYDNTDYFTWSILNIHLEDDIVPLYLEWFSASDEQASQAILVKEIEEDEMPTPTPQRRHRIPIQNTDIGAVVSAFRSPIPPPATMSAEEPSLFNLLEGIDFEEAPF